MINRARPSIFPFNKMLGKFMGHKYTDVAWVPSKKVTDVSGHRVSQESPNLKDLQINRDYYTCAAWAPQRNESVMEMTEHGPVERVTYTMRVDATEFPFNFVDDATISFTEGFHTEVRVTDVFVFDYFTHKKPSHAYRVISVYDDSDFSNIIRAIVVKMGTKDAVFIGQA